MLHHVMSCYDLPCHVISQCSSMTIYWWFFLETMWKRIFFHKKQPFSKKWHNMSCHVMSGYVMALRHLIDSSYHTIAIKKNPDWIFCTFLQKMMIFVKMSCHVILCHVLSQHVMVLGYLNCCSLPCWCHIKRVLMDIEPGRTRMYSQFGQIMSCHVMSCQNRVKT